MTSFLYNHYTSQWEAVTVEDVPANTYRVPNLPGDEEEYLEVPAVKANDPIVLRTLSKYRPPLAEKNGNGTLPSQKSRKRSLFEAEENSALPKMDCDQVRARIMATIERGMKVSEFTRRIHVSNQAYYRFMGQNGPEKGAGSDVYRRGMEFFALDDKEVVSSASDMGTPEPEAPAAKKSRTDTPPPAAPIRSRIPGVPSSPGTDRSRSISSSPPPVTGTGEPIPDISGIVLENELSDSCTVPYNADQVRSMINVHLAGSNDTQAAFLRTLMKQYHTEDKKIQSVQLQRFRGMRGPELGKSNPVYYAAGVFFEKIRRGRERDAKNEGGL